MNLDFDVTGRNDGVPEEILCFRDGESRKVEATSLPCFHHQSPHYTRFPPLESTGRAPMPASLPPRRRRQPGVSVFPTSLTNDDCNILPSKESPTSHALRRKVSKLRTTTSKRDIFSTSSNKSLSRRKATEDRQDCTNESKKSKPKRSKPKKTVSFAPLVRIRQVPSILETLAFMKTMCLDSTTFLDSLDSSQTTISTSSAEMEKLRSTLWYSKLEILTMRLQDKQDLLSWKGMVMQLMKEQERMKTPAEGHEANDDVVGWDGDGSTIATQEVVGGDEKGSIGEAVGLMMGWSLRGLEGARSRKAIFERRQRKLQATLAVLLEQDRGRKSGTDSNNNSSSSFASHESSGTRVPLAPLVNAGAEMATLDTSLESTGVENNRKHRSRRKFSSSAAKRLAAKYAKLSEFCKTAARQAALKDEAEARRIYCSDAIAAASQLKKRKTKMKKRLSRRALSSRSLGKQHQGGGDARKRNSDSNIGNNNGSGRPSLRRQGSRPRSHRKLLQQEQQRLQEEAEKYQQQQSWLVQQQQEELNKKQEQQNDWSSNQVQRQYRPIRTYGGCSTFATTAA